MGPGRRDYQGLLAAKAKYLCSEAALETTSIEVQIVGGLSAHKNMPLERAFRDVQTSTPMPPDTDVMLANIGKGNLGLLGALFRVDDSMKL
jgi:alkylation response protein AidB-like acyl-CoA dehydrogenase